MLYKWKNRVLLILGALFLVQLLYVDQLQIPGTALRLNFPWTGLALWSLAAFLFYTAERKQQGLSLWTAQALFYLTLFLFLSNFRWHGSDDMPACLLPFAILREGRLVLDTYASWFAGAQHDNVIVVNGHTVSLYPVMPSLLSLPVYLLPVLRGVQPVSDHVLHQLSKISASLITTGSVVFLFHIYRRRVSENWAFILALVYALGTAAFAVNSQGLWQHGTSSLMMVLALWALDQMDQDVRWAYAVGAFAVLAVASRTATAFLAVGLVLATATRGGWKGFRDGVLGTLLPAALLLCYWLGVVKAWLPAEFQIQNSLLHPPPKLTAMAGYLVSPGRGLFLFSPVVLFALYGISVLWRSPERWVERSTICVLVGSALTTFMMVCSYSAWQGGFSFGPRYLIETVTLLFYFLPAGVAAAVTQKKGRILWWSCVTVSVLCGALGAYQRWEWEKVVVSQSVWQWRAYPPVNLFSEP